MACLTNESRVKLRCDRIFLYSHWSLPYVCQSTEKKVLMSQVLCKVSLNGQFSLYDNRKVFLVDVSPSVKVLTEVDPRDRSPIPLLDDFLE